MAILINNGIHPGEPDGIDASMLMVRDIVKGSYKISFEDFMRLVAASMKIEAGVAVTKTMMEAVAEKILLKFGARAAQRLVPVVGAVI
ncbi:MAG: hypothetical protein EOP55_11615, partial [Sphingobacteriales bacterium]